MLPLGPLFVGLGLYVFGQLYEKYSRWHNLILLSVIFSALYAWLDGVMLGFSAPQFFRTALLSLPVAMLSLFFLDRYEDNLSKWFGVYVVSVSIYIIFL